MVRPTSPTRRIARDLHDTVIQQLFATGLGLQALAQRCKDDHPDIHQRLLEAVADLDRTIDQIRETIFSLQVPGGPVLRARILALAEETADTLGFTPHAYFRGPVDTRVPPEAGRQLVATLREALSNVARHAGASRVEVTVEAGDELVLRVADDGVGLPDERRRSGQGLRNMAERAYSLGGELEVETEPGRGTTLVWRVPLGR